MTQTDLEGDAGMILSYEQGLFCFQKLFAEKRKNLIFHTKAGFEMSSDAVRPAYQVALDKISIPFLKGKKIRFFNISI